MPLDTAVGVGVAVGVAVSVGITVSVGEAVAAGVVVGFCDFASGRDVGTQVNVGPDWSRPFEGLK